MMNELLTLLAQGGGTAGICLSLAYLYIRQLHKEARETENKRVTDQQAMVNKLLELNDKWMEAINAQVESAEAQKNVLTDLKQNMQDLKVFIQIASSNQKR